MARACATKRSLSSWTSYKEGLVDSGKSCGVLVVSPLLPCDRSHARVPGVFTQTSWPGYEANRKADVRERCVRRPKG